MTKIKKYDVMTKVNHDIESHNYDLVCHNVIQLLMSY